MVHSSIHKLKVLFDLEAFEFDGDVPASYLRKCTKLDACVPQWLFVIADEEFGAR